MHTISVVGHRGGPVGENAPNAYVLREHVEGDQDIAVVADRSERRLVVEGVASDQHILDDAP